MEHALYVLLGVCIGFGVRPVYVLLTGRDIPRERDEEDATKEGTR